MYDNVTLSDDVTQVLAETAETLSYGDVILAKCARERARERASSQKSARSRSLLPF